MVPIALNGPLLEQLVDAKGGVSAILDLWHARYGDESVPDKATIHRWINTDTLPGTSIKLLRFCALLDVDPFCVFVSVKGSPAHAIDRLLQAFNQRKWNAPSLQFLIDFFGRQSIWPPTHWADQHERFKYTWHAEEFEHDPEVQANFYAMIAISASSDSYALKPQTFHFAYSQKKAFGERWLHYGFVVQHRMSVTLTHINGQTDSYTAESIDDPTCVETWFGQGPAIFRIASMHPFSIDINPSLNQTFPAVRFQA